MDTRTRAVLDGNYINLWAGENFERLNMLAMQKIRLLPYEDTSSEDLEDGSGYLEITHQPMDNIGDNSHSITLNKEAYQSLLAQFKGDEYRPDV